MSNNNVDNRIVNMQFNNGQFENGIKTSIKSLNDLKKGLSLDGASNGLSNLSRAANSFSLSGMAQGVDAISSRFTNMGIVGMTAIQNITNSAMNAGKQLVNALTIDPIRSGFSEYETKIDAIAVMLANTAEKGTTIDDVTAELEKLNEYADNTIYNFGQMTDNMGKFTAAGLGLKESTILVKGMANVAAGFGVSAERMAGATYQMSQAMASGKVQLIDWKSMENSGMGGPSLQKELIKTAKSFGVTVSSAMAFRDTLESGWLTTEIFTKTMERLAEDPKLLKAATEFRTLTGTIGSLKEAIGSGWATSWEAIIGNKEQATVLFTDLGNSFNAMIKPSTEARNAALSFWNANGGRAAVIEGITNVIHGLSKVLKPIGAAFDAAFPKMTGERLVWLSEKFRDLTKGIIFGEGTIQKLHDTFAGLGSILHIGGQALLGIIDVFKKFIKNLLPVSDGFLSCTGSIGVFLTTLDSTIQTSGVFTAVFGAIGDAFGTVANGIKNAIIAVITAFGGFKTVDSVAMADSMTGPFMDFQTSLNKIIDSIKAFVNHVKYAFAKVKEAIAESMTFDSSRVENVIGKTLLGAILASISRFIWNLGGLFKSASKVVGSFSEVLEGVSGSLKAFQSAIKANAIRSIAVSIALLAASLVAMSLVNQDKLAKSFAALTGLFVELFTAMSVFGNLKGDVALFSLFKLTSAMIGLSVGVLILSFALGKLAKLDWNQLAKGLVGVGVLMAELVLFMQKGSFNKMGAASSFSIIMIAIALNILASAISKFASMNPKAMIQGLIGIGLVLAEFSLFTKYVKDTKTITYAAISLLLLGTALKTLAGAIKQMGELGPTALIKGLLAMAGALAMLTIAFERMDKLKNVGILSIALITTAVAIKILASSIEQLGKLPISTIAKGLLAIGGALAIIGGIGALLAPMAAELLILAGAVALFGVGCMAVGVGLLAFSTGLAALVVVGSAGVLALSEIIKMVVSLIPELLKSLAQGIIEFAKVITDGAPVIGKAFTAIIVSMVKSFVEAIPQLLEVVVQMIRDVCNIILVNMPEFMVTGAKIIVGFLQGVSNNIGQVVSTAATVIVNFINGMRSKIGDLVQAGFDLIIAFMNGLATAIENNMPILLGAVGNLIGALIKGVVYSIGAFFGIGQDAINGFIDGMKSKIKDLAETGLEVATNVLNAAKKVLGIKSPSKEFADIGMNVNEGFALGLTKYSYLTSDGIERLVGRAKQTFERYSASLKLADLIDNNIDNQPVIKPVIDLTNVNTELDSAFNKARGITVFNANTDAGFINQRMSAANNVSNNTPTQPAPGMQYIKHSGKITVEGVNNEGQLVAVIEKTIDKSITQGSRRLPNRVTIVPSMA